MSCALKKICEKWRTLICIRLCIHKENWITESYKYLDLWVFLALAEYISQFG